MCADQGQNGRVISPGYAEDASGTLSQREEQPVIGDNLQVNILLLFILVFLIISSILHYHPALLHRHALILGC